MDAPALTFVYIAEPPDYQVLACTLLASIREAFGDAVSAIGYCPEEKMGDLHPAVVEAHRMMGAEIRPLRVEGMWDSPYPHGNKILAAMAPRTGGNTGKGQGHTAFVDSDVLFLRPNRAANLVAPGRVSLTPAASMTWAGQEIWPRVYGALGMEMPEERVTLMRRSPGPVMPYFSSGLVVFPEGGERPFGRVWYDTARALDRLEDLPGRRPYLDQISLAPAIRAAGLDWQLLPEEQHYILGGKLRGQPLPEDREIYTVHYRHKGVLKELGLHKLAKTLLRRQIGVPYVRRLTEDANG